MIKKLIKIVKDNFTSLTISLSNVEKNTLGQNGQQIITDINHARRNNEGKLADSLVHGELTQEVKNLRWRTYKILNETDDLKSEIVGYDENGVPVVKTFKINKKIGLNKIKLDTYDDYPLELSFINDDISMNINDSISNNYLKDKETNIKNEDGTNTLAEISSLEYYCFYKAQKPIIIERSFIPKFEIEKYTKKLNVRVIDDNTRLLEFYVSKYPDKFNKTNKLFIREISKIIDNPKSYAILSIENVSFVTNKTIGAYDNRFYKYNNIKFDKIIEFNGNYVIKFIANVINNGDYILERYREIELDNKYKIKEKK